MRQHGCCQSASSATASEIIPLEIETWHSARVASTVRREQSSMASSSLGRFSVHLELVVGYCTAPIAIRRMFGSYSRGSVINGFRMRMVFASIPSSRRFSSSGPVCRVHKPTKCDLVLGHGGELLGYFLRR